MVLDDAPRDPSANGSGSEILRILFLKAARAILQEPDTALDLRKVAERAGKSRTAPYLAFGKADEGGGLPALRQAVAAEGLGELAANVRLATGSARDPESALQAAASAYLHFARAHPRLFRLIFGTEVAHDMELCGNAADASSPGRREWTRLTTQREALMGALRQVLELAREGSPGYVREVDPTEALDLAAAFWAMIHGVALLTLDSQWSAWGVRMDHDLDELAARVLRHFTHAPMRALELAVEAQREADQMRGEAEAMPGAQAQAAPQAESEPPSQGENHAMPDAMFEGGYIVREEYRPFHDDDAPPRRHSRPPRPEPGPESETRRSQSPPGFTLHAQGSLEPAGELTGALQRARAQADLLKGARILWVDDQPGHSDPECRVLTGLGAQVVRPTDTETALRELGRQPFHLVISDIARGRKPDAGVRALPAIRKASGDVPVIFYVYRVDPGRPPPPGSFGITDSPEELLHLVLDALGRGKRRR
ncbi:MAG: WHG domain-containing protein [Gemmatimonadota bacterium]